MLFLSPWKQPFETLDKRPLLPNTKHWVYYRPESGTTKIPSLWHDSVKTQRQVDIICNIFIVTSSNLKKQMSGNTSLCGAVKKVSQAIMTPTLNHIILTELFSNRFVLEYFGSFNLEELIVVSRSKLFF